MILATEDGGLINGAVPPGEILAANSTIVSLDYENGLYFATWKITRPPGFRTPVHIHPRPLWMCLAAGCVRDDLEGYEPREFCAPDCWWSPSNTKMSSLTIGNVTKEEYDMFILDELPNGDHIPDWLITEPGYADIDQYI